MKIPERYKHLNFTKILEESDPETGFRRIHGTLEVSFQAGFNDPQCVTLDWSAEGEDDSTWVTPNFDGLTLKVEEFRSALQACKIQSTLLFDLIDEWRDKSPVVEVEKKENSPDVSLATLPKKTEVSADNLKNLVAYLRVGKFVTVETTDNPLPVGDAIAYKGKVYSIEGLNWVSDLPTSYRITRTS